MNRCCRNANINTGPQGTNFYITSDLDLCTAIHNSSPQFTDDPKFVVSVNQPSINFISAADMIDFDSLSFNFEKPLQSLTDTVIWSSGFAYNIPFSVYWPTGYNKANGPQPGASPPIGLYFDIENGYLIFTPTDTLQTVMCIVVKEWRKDMSGKHKQIGEIRREINLIVKVFPNNNPPLLNGASNYTVCAGTQICFTITSDDKQFIPPPPAKANPLDTVSLTWNRGIPGATFNIVNPKARLQAGKFCWTPDETKASDLPYTFTVTARDNSCPKNEFTIKSYTVKVNQIAKTEIVTKNITPSSVELRSIPNQNFRGTPSFLWEIMDSTGTTVDTSYFKFKGTGTSSILNPDTVTFKKTGQYYIHNIINNAPLNCPSNYFDTLRISSLSRVGISKVKSDFIRIYPNPAQQYLTVAQIKTSQSAIYQIFNPVGELIQSGDLMPSQSTINISQFINGIYFIKISNEIMTYSFQFLKRD